MKIEASQKVGKTLKTIDLVYEKKEKERLQKELLRQSTIISSSKDLNEISRLQEELTELRASNQSLLASVYYQNYLN